MNQIWNLASGSILMLCWISLKRVGAYKWPSPKTQSPEWLGTFAWILDPDSDDTQMTSMKIVYFQDSHHLRPKSLPSTSKFSHSLDLRRPIFKQPRHPLQKTIKQYPHRSCEQMELKQQNQVILHVKLI